MTRLTPGGIQNRRFLFKCARWSYKAEDVRLQRTVAVKVLAAPLAGNPQYLARFQQEAQAAARLNHPHIVTLHDVGLGEEPYIVMEYVAGHSLAEILKSEGKLSSPRTLEIGMAVAEALGVAHTQGIVHRDIKPANILVADSGMIKVTDFGLAHSVEETELMGFEAVVGTVAYLAPEQISGEKAGPEVDLYALGAVLYEALTGRPPFADNDVAAVLYKHLNEDPVPPRELAPEIPSELQAVVLTLLAKGPEKRYRSAAGLAQDFRQIETALGKSKAPLIRAAGRGTIPGNFRAPLTGRDGELAALQGYLDEARRGEGRLVFIVGEVGSGKTRLLEELRMRGKKLDVLFLTGRCLYTKGSDPYRPFTEALREYAGIDRSDSDVLKLRKIEKAFSEQIPELAEVEPVVKALLVGGGSPASTPEERQERQRRLFWAVLRTLVQAAGRCPLALFLEDLHWADSATLELLDFVARGIQGRDMLVVGTYRPEELIDAETPHPLRERLPLMSREGLFTEIRLERLSAEAVTEIVQSLFPGVEFPEPFLARLQRETDGNPFFLLESLKLMRDEGILRWEDAGWMLVDETWEDTAGFRLPARVYDAIVRRIERLDAGDRELLECAAVEGEGFASDTLVQVLGRERMDVLQALGRLERVHQLVRSAGIRYRFDHPRVQEVLYRELGKELKRAFHQAIGEYREQAHADDPETVIHDLAYHFSRSDDVEKAIDYLVRAGERARELHAEREAIAQLKRAAERLAKEPDGQRQAQRIAVGETLGDLHMLLGETESAFEWYKGAIVLSAKRRQRAELRRKMGRACQPPRRNHEEAAAHLRTALEELKGEFAPVETARILLNLADLHNAPDYSGFDPARFLGLCQEALGILEGTGHHAELAKVYANLSMHHGMAGDLEPMLASWKRSLEISERVQDLEAVARAHDSLGHCMAHYFGDVARAIQSFEESLKIQESLGDIHHQAVLHFSLGKEHAKRGDLEQAGKHLKRALDLSREMGETQMVGRSEMSLGDLYRVQGRLDEAIVYYQAAAQAILRYGYSLNVAGLLQKLEGTLVTAGREGEFETFCLELQARMPDEVANLPLQRWWGESGEPGNCFQRVVFADSFDAADLKPEWKWVDPRGRGRYRLLKGAGGLEIVPPLGVGLLANVDAPRMVREVEGDFVAEARLVPGSRGERGAGGLLVWKGAEQFVRFEGGVLEPESVMLSGRSEKGFVTVGRCRLEATALHLRIERQGERMAAWCGDGKCWWHCGELILEAPDPLEVGLYAECSYPFDRPPQTRPVRCAWFRIFEPSAARFVGQTSDEEVERSMSRTRILPQEQLSLLLEVSRAVNSTLELEEVLELALDRVIRSTGAERGLVILVDETSGGVRIGAARDMDQETLQDAEEISQGIVNGVIGGGDPVISVDAKTDPLFGGHESVRLYDIRSVLCIPLRCRDAARGAIYLDHRGMAGAFSRDDLPFFRGLADQIGVAVENARLYGQAQQEIVHLTHEVRERYRFENIIGESEGMREMFRMMEKVIPSATTVMIKGESGTGKELVVRAIHYSGPRREKRFVAQNCAALPEELLESELFGHRRGAFTGAVEDKVGLFEVADGGTIFLDEIVDTSPAVQAKLLRVLEDGEVRRVGETEPRQVDVRIISATSKDLEEEIRQGRFRSDLYFRLDVVAIPIPSLRERRNDIPLLVAHFVEKHADRAGKAISGCTRATMDLLLEYDWPGNVRELENAIERGVLMADADHIALQDLPPALRGMTLSPKEIGDSLHEHERHHILRVLEKCGWNKHQAASRLGISRSTLYGKLKRYGLQEPS